MVGTHRRGISLGNLHSMLGAYDVTRFNLGSLGIAMGGAVVAHLCVENGRGRGNE